MLKNTIVLFLLKGKYVQELDIECLVLRSQADACAMNGKKIYNRADAPEELNQFQKYLDRELLNLDWKEIK